MTNSLVEQQFGLLDNTLELVHQLFETIYDADLVFKLPGDNPTLGGLLREMGEITQDYVNSFRTFQCDFTYRHADPSVEHSVPKLKAWFQQLETDMKAALSALTEDEIQTKTVHRARGYIVPVTIQFHIYREGILIFCAKISVYLKAMQKPMTPKWVDWIG